ncbi:MAG: hypothetical protein V1793_25070 [Pseudomonadota bacterium]
MVDINVVALNDAVEITEKESNLKLQKMENEIDGVRKESFALGVLQKINYDNAHNELIKYATLYQIKQKKEYKDNGMTWEQFCEATGETVRNVDRILKDIEPLYDKFSDKLVNLLEVPFNKIKYLGKSISDNLSKIEDGVLVIDNTKIPLTPDNKEEIEAAIDTLIETHKQEKQALKKDLVKYKKHADKIVEEETKGLKVERDALIREVERLKPFDITEMDSTWSGEHLDKLMMICADFEVNARKFMIDERLHEDMKSQAKGDRIIDTLYRMARQLKSDWDEAFNTDIEE